MTNHIHLFTHLSNEITFGEVTRAFEKLTKKFPDLHPKMLVDTDGKHSDIDIVFRDGDEFEKAFMFIKRLDHDIDFDRF